MKIFLPLIPWLMFLAVPLRSQEFYPRHYLLEDIDSLCITIREVHPDMFAILPEEDFYQALSQSKELVTDSMTRLGFCRVIMPLISALGDGHTAVYFPYQDSKNPL